MKYALNLDDDGRILSVTYEEFATDGMPVVDEIPEGNVADYRFVEQEFVYDPLPEPEQPSVPNEATVWDELDAAYREGVDSV